MSVHRLTIAAVCLAASGIVDLASAQVVVIDQGVVTVTGTDGAETILVSQVGDQIVVDINGSETPFDADQVQEISIDARGGDDTVTVDVNRPTTILAGAGNDAITGSDGGADLVIGQQGTDTFSGRGGDDVFVWNPGDGNDIIDGDDGNDTMLFNGSAAAEIFDASANGFRLRFTRNVGNIVMDVGTTERIDLRAFGGDDATTINNLDGTDVTDVIVDAGPGNDTFVGSALPETFLGGEGDDTATMGDGDFFEMGAGVDTLHFFGSAGSDNIHVDARTNGDHDEVFFHGTLGNQRAVFENGEVVTVFTQGGDDKVKVHTRAASLWDVEIVE